MVATTTAGILVTRSVKKTGAEQREERKRVLRVRVEKLDEKEKGGEEEEGGESALFVTVRGANGGRNAAESGGIVAARFAPPPKMGEVWTIMLFLKKGVPSIMLSSDWSTVLQS